MNKIIPSGSLVLVRVVDAKTSKGGIVLPSVVRENERFRRAKVLAIGPTCERRVGQDTSEVFGVGETVLVDLKKAAPIPGSETEQFLVRDDRVLALVE